jgi:molybdopterin-guanine dinucleotide biosynthesis protein A
VPTRGVAWLRHASLVAVPYPRCVSGRIRVCRVYRDRFLDDQRVSEPPIGAVLAGGASRRMGQPKATLELAGRPLAARAVDIVEAAGLQAFVVAKSDSPLPDLAAPVIAEPDEPRHPLTGIVAALRAAGGRPVVMLGCDMPLVPPPLLAHLAELIAAPGRRAVVAEVGGEIEPLLAAYAPTAKAPLAAALAEGRPLREAVAALEPDRLGGAELRGFGDPETLASNVNTPADLERAAALLSSPPPR